MDHSSHYKTSHQTTTVVINQPQSSSGLLLVDPKGIREWTTGICGCFEDCNSCLLGTFCAQCFLCWIAHRQGDCCGMPICAGYAGGAAMAIRARIRTMGGIRGTICNDCVTTQFCFPCALCQLHREMKAMGL